jgi:hypothetical protein
MAAGTYGGTLANLPKFARYRITTNRLLGLLPLLAAAYFNTRDLDLVANVRFILALRCK